MRRLRRQVAFCHVVVSAAKAGQFVQKHTRSLARRRRRRHLRTLTAPGRSLGPGRRAAGRAEYRARVPASLLMFAMMAKIGNMAASSTMEIAIAAGKHGRVAMSRSPWVRPGTWNSCAGGGAPAMLQRSPFALQWCPALRRRWAPQNNSCAFHRMWNTTRGSLRSRSAAKSCASPCSTSVIGGQKHELDAIVYFDLLFRFSCPRQFRDRWLGVAGRRATRT